MRAVLKKNNMEWTQATKESVPPFMVKFRIHLFPSSILVGPDGKILSLNARDSELSLRGNDLLKTLDRILPP